MLKAKMKTNPRSINLMDQTKNGEKGRKWAQQNSLRTQQLKEGSSGGCGDGGLAERDAELLLPWLEGAYM